MEKQVKDAMISSINAKEEIENFVESWYDTEELFKTEAEAAILLLAIERGNFQKLAEEDIHLLSRLMEQHNMMTNLIYRVTKGEAEA